MHQNRHYHSINPHKRVWVTQEEALFANGASMNDFISDIVPYSTIGLFEHIDSTGVWQSRATDPILPAEFNKTFRLYQKAGYDTFNQTPFFRYIDIQPSHLTITKFESKAPVKQSIIAGGFLTPATGGIYQITMIDNTKATQKYPRYSFQVELTENEITALALNTDALRRAEIVNRFVAKMNDKKANAWYADGVLYTAAPTATDGVGIVIETVFENETFDLVAFSIINSVEYPATIYKNGAAFDGSTSTALVYSQGQFRDVDRAEKDGLSRDSYQYQNLTRGWFEDRYPTPNLYAEKGCTYTMYMLNVTRQYQGNFTGSQTTNTHKDPIAIFVKEDGGASSLLDVVFSEIPVKLIS